MNPLDLAAKATPPLWLNPWAWLALIAWTVIVGGLSMYYGYGEATEKAELDANSRAVEAIQAVIDENAATLATERSLRAVDRAKHESFVRESEKAKDETENLIARLRTGSVRLRAPVTRCESSAPDSGPASTTTGQEGYAELSPEFSVPVVQLLQRGDEGIRNHNAVVDRYERLRLACAGNPPTTTESKP